MKYIEKCTFLVGMGKILECAEYQYYCVKVHDDDVVYTLKFFLKVRPDIFKSLVGCKR